jgi:hypothetical protein
MSLLLQPARDRWTGAFINQKPDLTTLSNQRNEVGAIQGLLGE